MKVVDAQVHAWEADSPERPWDANFAQSGPLAQLRFQNVRHPVSTDQLITEMDRARVDAALVVTPALYGFDNSYSLEASLRYPDRLAVIGRLDLDGQDLDERIKRWRAQPGMLGFRVAIATDQDLTAAQDGALTSALTAAQRHHVPICLGCPGYLDHIEPLVRQFPDLQIVIDHLGLRQYPRKPDPEPFEKLPKLLALAQYPNVAVKATGVPMLSLVSYPYRDVWPALHRILDTFGLDRVMWGSDFTRCELHHTYEQGIDYIRDSDELSDSDRAKVMSGTLCHIFRWEQGPDRFAKARGDTVGW